MLYPAIKDLIAFRNHRSSIRASGKKVKAAIAGNHHSPFRGQGLEFDSVRKYIPGDDIRSIDWRVTARSGSPHIKLFREERERHLVLCIDMNAAMRFGTRNTFKSVQAARIAAYLGWQGIAHHDRVSACLFGDVPGGIHDFAPTRTRQSFCALLKMLSTSPAEEHHVPLEKALGHIAKTAHTGSLIYLISDFMDLPPDFQSHISLNRKCDVVFISINDPADSALFPVGTLAFSSNGMEKITVNTENISGRDLYNKQWMENRKLLSETASRAKIPLIELTTESDIHRDLELKLKYATKRRRR